MGFIVGALISNMTNREKSHGLENTEYVKNAASDEKQLQHLLVVY